MLQGLYDSGCLGSAVLCDGFGNETEVNRNGFGALGNPFRTWKLDALGLKWIER